MCAHVQFSVNVTYIYDVQIVIKLYLLQLFMKKIKLHLLILPQIREESNIIRHFSCDPFKQVMLVNISFLH